MDLKQLNIFDSEQADRAPEPETEYVADPVFDALMAKLDFLNKRGQEDLDMLNAMIAELKTDTKETQIINQENKTEKMAKELTTEAIETLKKSTVNGLVVKLPEGQLERKIYLEVKERLELIGGKWKGGKVAGFVFQECPKELLEQIANGEKRNLKQEYQFFGTPDGLADRLVELADINIHNIILEPSAGQGAIVKAINRAVPDVHVDCYEAMPVNISILKKMPSVIFKGEDFLAAEEKYDYDRIIANPPFSKNQDIDHVYKMWSVLKPGGRIVTITSKHWQLSQNKKETQFRQWLELNKAEIIEVEAGEFKESGTTIATVILVINKL